MKDMELNGTCIDTNREIEIYSETDIYVSYILCMSS